MHATAETSKPSRAMTLDRTRPDCSGVGVCEVTSHADSRVSLENENCNAQNWKQNGQEPEYMNSRRLGLNKHEVEAYTAGEFNLLLFRSL